MNRRNIAGAVLALSLVVAGCSETVGESADDLCTSLEALDTTIEEIAGAGASAETTTVESVQNAVSEVDSAVQDVQEAESDLSDSLRTQLQEDFDEMQSSIQGIPAESTLAEAGDEVVAAVAAFKTSWDQTLTELDCSTDG